MDNRSASSLGLTRLLVQAIIALIIGIVVSICTLLVQIFLVLLGRAASTYEEHTQDETGSHVSGCSLCMRRNRMNSSVRTPDASTERNQSDASVSQVA